VTAPTDEEERSAHVAAAEGIVDALACEGDFANHETSEHDDAPGDLNPGSLAPLGEEPAPHDLRLTLSRHRNAAQAPLSNVIETTKRELARR
jgi:hypothetical protein